MATYAIGDLQGCFATLERLLDEIGFDARRDRLWFVGDLVNRGPDSLACLRFVHGLGDAAVTVLGNHDLHLIARAAGKESSSRNDTLDPVLAAPDGPALIDWLRAQPLFHSEGGHHLVHAGVLPQWDPGLARALAGEVHDALTGPAHRDVLARMYGNQPDRWDPALAGMDRLRLAINAFTRIRVVRADGAIDLKFKGEAADIPAGTRPWFERLHPGFAGSVVIAGHWSALGLHLREGFVGIDTGCVWGRSLTAYRLEDRRVIQVPCAEASVPEGWD